jgi:hypothetical protein
MASHIERRKFLATLGGARHRCCKEARADRAAADPNRGRLPLDKLKAPKGFTIDVYASGIDNARFGSATRARCSSRVASRTRSTPSSTRAARAKSRSSPRACIAPMASSCTRARSISRKSPRFRRQARQPAEADRHLQRPAEGRGARLEPSGPTRSSTSIFAGGFSGKTQKSAERFEERTDSANWVRHKVYSPAGGGGMPFEFRCAFPPQCGQSVLSNVDLGPYQPVKNRLFDPSRHLRAYPTAMQFRMIKATIIAKTSQPWGRSKR